MESKLFLSVDDVNILFKELMKKYKGGWEIKFTGDNFILKGMMTNITIEYNGYIDGIIYFYCKNSIITNIIAKIFPESINRKLPDVVNLNYPHGSIVLKDLVFKGKKIFDNNITIESIEKKNGLMIKFNLTNLDLV